MFTNNTNIKVFVDVSSSLLFNPCLFIIGLKSITSI